MEIRNLTGYIVFEGHDMSWHNLVCEDMVAPLTAKVCITCHAALNDIASMHNLQCRFQQCPWDIGSVWQKGWDKGMWVGIHTQRVKQHGFGCKSPSVGSFLPSLIYILAG